MKGMGGGGGVGGGVVRLILGDPGAISQGLGAGSPATNYFENEQGAPSSVLENFRRAISSPPTDCPWVFEDGWGHAI